MSINPIHGGGGPRPVPEPGRSGGSGDEEGRVEPVEAGDRVEISAEARDLAAREKEGAAIPAGKAAEMKSLLEAGAYDTPEILREIALRLLESDDL